MKKFITFLIVLLIVVAVIWVILFVNKDRILKYTIEKGISGVHENILKGLPASVEKSHIDSLFMLARKRLEDGSLKVEDLSSFTSTFREYYTDGRLDSIEVETLVRELENVVQRK